MPRPREFDEEQVLDAVMDTFWRNGYEATSAQALVDATGLGRGSLYAAYASKDGLFEQALLHYRNHAKQHAGRLRKPGSPLLRLRKFMTGIVDEDIKSAEKRGCLATNSAIEMAGRHPHIAGLVRQNFHILIQGIEETVRRGQSEGEIRADADAAAMALFLFNAVQGLRVLAKTASAKDRPGLVSVIDRTLAALA